MEFKSQICTTKEQSERLLKLGLKKETADMKYIPYSKCAVPSYFDDEFGFKDAEYVPAWSLHRLWCMLPKYVHIETYKYRREYIVALDLIMDSYQNIRYLEGVDESYYDKSFYANDVYESICKAIEWLIKDGYFNKDYLEEKK